MVVINENNYSFENDFIHEIMQKVDDSICSYFSTLNGLMDKVEIGDNLTNKILLINKSLEVILKDMMLNLDNEKRKIMDDFVAEVKSKDDFYQMNN